jgi:hypothetical protein
MLLQFVQVRLLADDLAVADAQGLMSMLSVAVLEDEKKANIYMYLFGKRLRACCVSGHGLEFLMELSIQ